MQKMIASQNAKRPKPITLQRKVSRLIWMNPDLRKNLFPPALKTA